MLIRHSMIYVTAKLLPGALGMATTALLTRLLTPEQYGFYGLALIIMAFGSTIGFEWLGLSFLRFYQTRRGDPRVTGTILQMFFCLVLLTAALTGVALAVHLIRGRDAPIILSGLVLMWSFVWFELTAKFQVAEFRPMRYLMMNMARALFSLVSATLAAWLTRDPVWTAIGTAAGTAAGTTLGRFRGLHVGPKYFDGALARTILVFGLPLAASNAMIGLVSSGTRTLVGALDSAAALGLYTADFMLIQNTLAVVAGGMATASYQLAVRAVESGDAQVARRQLLANGTLLLAVMAPAALGMALTAHGIAITLVGHQYVAEVTRLTPWMAAGTFFATVRAHFLDHAFQLGRKSHLQIWISGAAAVWAVGLSVWLIPRMGPVGAAIAMTVAMAFSCVHAAILGRRAYRMPFPGGGILRIALACALMAAAVLMVPWGGIAGFLLRVAAGGAVYTATVVATDLLGLRQALLSRLESLRAPRAVQPVTD